MSGHTKGPWKLDGGKQEWFSVRADHYGVVCNIPGYGIGAREANARLIAAAPELLEALEECKEVMADPFAYGETCISDAIAKARAAIAKAKGEA